MIIDIPEEGTAGKDIAAPINEGQNANTVFFHLLLDHSEGQCKLLDRAHLRVE
jgi:hypothetical protein